jgi:hypothetical protein
MHSNASLDFGLDLDAPELLQALEDFTQQILSPGNQLSSGLEEAMLSIVGVPNEEESAQHDCSPLQEDTRTRIVEQEEEEEIPMEQDDTTTNPVPLIPEVKTELYATPTASPQSTTTTTTTTTHNEDILPLAEPEFQILTDFSDAYGFSSESLDMSSSELQFMSDDVKPNPKEVLFMMDSYPYDAWGSPGSVESDNLFPELA